MAIYLSTFSPKSRSKKSRPSASRVEKSFVGNTSAASTNSTSEFCIFISSLLSLRPRCASKYEALSNTSRRTIITSHSGIADGRILPSTLFISASITACGSCLPTCRSRRCTSASASSGANGLIATVSTPSIPYSSAVDEVHITTVLSGIHVVSAICCQSSMASTSSMSSTLRLPSAANVRPNMWASSPNSSSVLAPQ